MTVWQSYPNDYRAREIDEILAAVSAGQCVSVVGLSGAGKSNLLGFLAHRVIEPALRLHFILVDNNRLIENSPSALFRLMRRALEGGATSFSGQQDLGSTIEELAALDSQLEEVLGDEEEVCLLLDRFEILAENQAFAVIASNLRALRDAHKYRLTYVTATRRPLDPHTELAELFFGRTLWLGPLSASSALWSAKRDAARFFGAGSNPWEQEILERLIEVSWGYPALLRAACEAYAVGASLEIEELRAHPAVALRVAEFWADNPNDEALRASGLEGQPLLMGDRPAAYRILPVFNTTKLTAKENLLLAHFLEHAGQVCEKDNLIQAVWPEDVIFERGIRDDSLAQLVRRLRVKIEPDSSEPTYIHTVPGRGYLFRL